MTTVDTELHELLTAIREGKNPDSAPTLVNLRMTGKWKSGAAFMWSAALLLGALAAAQGYVSFRAQYAFIFAAKHQHLPSALEALGLDTGAIIFALLGLAKARMGKQARIERILNVACALGSAAMNLLAGDLGSPRSVVVYTMPAVLYAACSDRLIATAASSAGVPEASVWRWLGTVVLYALRALVAFPSTVAGLRRAVLAATPLPAAPAQALPVAPPGGPAQARAIRPRSVPRARAKGESKKAVLLRLYADHPDHGDRTKVSAVATELAPLAKLQAGSARSYLYAALDGATP